MRQLPARAAGSKRIGLHWPSVVLGAIGILVGTLAMPAAAAAADSPRRPNIVVILGDDLGYADMGSFGSEIRTPNMDSLANKGVRFTSFYTNPTCSPTRATLLSGVDTHRNGLGNMDEWTAPNQRGAVGYEGHLNDRVATLPQLLKDAGYHTYMVGKWHLGKSPEQIPRARGFERDFSLLDGAGSYWDMTNMTSASPVSTFTEDGRYLTELPKDYYATKTYTDKLIRFIDDNRGDGKPFFAYVAHQAPHDPSICRATGATAMPANMKRVGMPCARSASSGRSNSASCLPGPDSPSACGSSPTPSFWPPTSRRCSAGRWSSMRPWWKTSITMSVG